MLITTLPEFQKFTSVNNSFSIENVTASIKDVERKIIKPILGASLYNSLITAYEAQTLTAKQAELLEMCQYPLALLAYNQEIAKLSVQVSDAGIRVSTGQDGEFRTASRWQIEELKKSTLIEGYNHLESLLEFLQDNVADYLDWNYAEQNSDFINNAIQFSQYRYINESRLIFIKLKSPLQKAERKVANSISQQQFDVFKAILVDKDTDFTAAQKPVIELLRLAIANFAYSEGIYTMPVLVEGDKISIFSNQFMADFDPKVMPDSGILAYMKRDSLEEAESAIKQAIDLMEADLPSFPEYELYAYTAPENIEDTDIEDSGFFFA